MPKALLERPTLDERLSLLYGVFQEVNRGRQYDMGEPLPLSFKDVSSYCSFVGVEDSYTRELYYDFCVMVDDIWLKIQSRKKEAEAAKNKSRSKK